jgi:hypothetical protein
MKPIFMMLMLAVTAGLCVGASAVLAQNAGYSGQLHAYYRAVPLHGASQEEVMRGAMLGTTIPMFSYTFTASRDGLQHSGVMVGRSPFFHGARSTNIPTIMIPVIFKLPDNVNNALTRTFDPTATDSTCSPNGKPLTLVQNSPVLQPVNFTMPGSGGINVGTGQYIDEFQRANFWTNVSVTGDSYHTVLSPVSTAPAQIVTVPAISGLGYGANQFRGSPCTGLGVVTIDFWDPSLNGLNTPGEAQTILNNLGIGPTTFPIFVFYNVVIANVPSPFDSSCCILGYHNAQGNPVQTFSVADYETTRLFAPGEDISAMSHEIGEWLDDPLVFNIVPLWGHIGQASGCQDNLEVGDPLTGTQFPSVLLGSMTYHPQELAFFSWFYGAPSIGVDGVFSNNGTFAVDAGGICS